MAVHFVLAAQLGRQLREALEAASGLGFELDNAMTKPRWVLTGPQKHVPTIQVRLCVNVCERGLLVAGCTCWRVSGYVACIEQRRA